MLDFGSGIVIVASATVQAIISVWIHVVVSGWPGGKSHHTIIPGFSVPTDTGYPFGVTAMFLPGQFQEQTNNDFT